MLPRLHPIAALLGLVLATGACSAVRAADTEPLHLVVLHSNDIHGQAQPLAGRWVDRENPPPRGGLSRLAGELAAAEAAARADGAHVLVVDGGDWFQGTPEGLVDDGRAFVELLGEIGYDAMVVGNHEFDHGVPYLADLLGAGIVPHVLANVREPSTGERVAWCVPYRIEQVGDLRVALVGLLTTGTPAITHADARALDFVEPGLELATVRAELEALAEPVDLILPITHLGVSADRDLARAHPDLPLIVGGHSHTTLAEGVREGDTLIVQAGCKAMVMGRVDLYLDPVTLAVLSSSAHLVELPPDAELDDAALAEACAALTAIGAEEMDLVVGRFEAPLLRSRGVASGSAGNWITDAFRSRLGTDVAIQNRGGIRRDIEAGEVRRRDLFEMQPFGNTLVAIELTGAELFTTVERALTDRKHSGIEFSGMTVHYRGEAPDLELVAVTVGGEPLDPAATYSLATNSFLAGGGDTYLPESVIAREAIDTGLVLRDVAEEALAGGAGVHVDSTNRYLEAEQP
ncbi:MAG: bifunctional UDP-sugar hydrolase/5'-nucleotidase [Planctomycetota bacterium]|nr:bifunctional UDP-sugar hydrolase/5'-nucleotidase [Planctomycetota bacterium]